MKNETPAFPFPLQVSRPVLPSIESFFDILRPLWTSRRLSNGVGFFRLSRVQPANFFVRKTEFSQYFVGLFAND